MTVIELRRYTLHPGARDTLIDLFDLHFVEAQEEAGMRIIGQFRHLDERDQFVWLRSFPDMAARERALAAFYGGPVWRAHAAEANATMIDSDNVLLLRPARPGSGFPPGALRPAPGTTARPSSVVSVTICNLPGPADPALVALAADRILPLWADTGAEPLALLETEPAPNTFPALPVREGEHVLAWLCRFDDQRSWQIHNARLQGDARQGPIFQAMGIEVLAYLEHFLLEPTARSALR